MATVLVVGEHRDGKLKKSAFEIVGKLSSLGHEVHVALLGESVSGFAAEFGPLGATKVHTLEAPEFKYYTAEAYTKALVELVNKLKPTAVFGSHTPTGRDFLPRLAYRLDAGYAADIISLEFEGGKFKAKRPMYAGKALAEVEFLGNGIQVMSVRPNALGATKGDASKQAAVEKQSANLGALATKVKEVVVGQSARPDVTEASVVVSGGRSLKNAENFKILEELADTLGAAVGASRAAVDAGYRPHRDQVGQTGKVVSPSLYIACGISGAIQHMAGMRTSKVIVAINTDPEAPIFQVADYGIVADLFQVVPLLKEEFKKLKES